MFVVTGATGYVGGVLVRTLLGKAEQVRVVVPPFEKAGQLEGLNVENQICRCYGLRFDKKKQ